MKKHFSAPWSTTLKLMTAGVLVLLLGATFFTGTFGSIVILVVLLLCAAFAVRGYSIFNGKLMIHRLGWSKDFDLSELTSAEFSPGATMGSIRTWGIGGVFSFVGYFRNSILGTYRAYATNEESTVVLDFDGKKVVVTPEAPAEFVEALHVQQAE